MLVEQCEKINTNTPNPYLALSLETSSSNFDMEMELLFPQWKEFREETEHPNRGVFISVPL